MGTNHFKVEAVKNHESARSHQESRRIKSTTTGGTDQSLAGRSLSLLKTSELEKMQLLFRSAHAIRKKGFHWLRMDVWISELTSTLLFTCFIIFTGKNLAGGNSDSEPEFRTLVTTLKKDQRTRENRWRLGAKKKSNVRYLELFRPQEGRYWPNTSSVSTVCCICCHNET